MDDSLIFNDETAQRQQVIFGAYGVDEWIASSYLHGVITVGQTTIAFDGTWITPAGWDMTAWAASLTPRFNFASAQRAVLFGPFGLIEATHTRGKLNLEVHGPTTEVHLLVEGMDRAFKRAENLIEWIYSPRGDSISVPLNYRPAIEGSYPWLPKPLMAYIDDYLNAEASVLILIGPPGTGKTTFIKNLIHRSGADAKVTYDETVMSGDGLFANFIEGDARFLIMEDADAFLSARADGNTMMHRFLNVSDGLISAKDKKLVFSTNLPSVREIDDALLRPGRCFDIVEFRALTRPEAEVVAAALGRPLPDGSSFTLAEVCNLQPSEQGRRLVSRGVGFV